MAYFKTLFLFAAVVALAYAAEEARDKRGLLGAYPYAAVVAGTDDGSYYPGKYDGVKIVAAAPAISAYSAYAAPPAYSAYAAPAAYSAYAAPAAYSAYAAPAAYAAHAAYPYAAGLGLRSIVY